MIFAFCLAAGAAPGADFIRQIQMLGGAPVIYDISISSNNGTVMSNPLVAESSVFQLYTTIIGANNIQTLVKLDEKSVGTFLPSVTVQALSEDPYFPPRTRADKPYGIRITIAGMQPDSPDVPAYAKSVQVARSYKLYDSSTYLPTGQGGDYADSFTFRTNGTFVDNAILPRLPGERPTKTAGEESFTVYLHPGSGVPQSELGKATVQIWPVADGVIEGIEQGKTYLDVPQSGSIALRDLYPKSVTYAQVYRGPQQTGIEGIPLPSTVVAFDTYAPQNARLTLADLEQAADDDGLYTIEVLTITPFNDGAPELLAHVTFRLKRTLEVNAAVTTIEKR